MKAWEIGPRGGVGSLRFVERNDPEAGPGEILVRVRAAGLNYRDLMVLRGQYGDRLPEHRIPLTDGVGIVEELGEGVEGFSAGDRVVAAHFVDWDPTAGFGQNILARDIGVTMDGWLAERIVLPAKSAIIAPMQLRDETAATLSVAASTVWHAMIEFGASGSRDLQKRMVLAQGTGGIAIFSLRLAKALGAKFAITSSSDQKLAKARDLGADYAVNYLKRPDWGAALLEETGGRGADIIIDTSGFGDFDQTLRAAAPGARIATLGALSGSPRDEAGFAQSQILSKNITIKGITSGHRGMLEAAMGVMAEHSLQNLVSDRFSFTEARDAYSSLEKGSHMGKILVRISD